MRITGTFVNPLGGDIPDQNWGVEDWENDFKAMDEIGIDTVIFCSGGMEWLAYPSEILINEYNAFRPLIDYIDLFLSLAEKYNMKAFVGCIAAELPDREAMFTLTNRVTKELWDLYGHRESFQGWYLPKEVSHNMKPFIDEYVEIGKYCKQISGGLPILLSPGMLGRKAWLPNEAAARDLDYKQHEKDFDEIFGRLSSVVDIIAFQDGHVDYWQLPEALRINKKLADKHGMEYWTNAESFDRDTGKVRFPPIRWEKLLAKLRMAEDAGATKAITWEFSYFMSPNALWGSARNLNKRYKEYFDL